MDQKRRLAARRAMMSLAFALLPAVLSAQEREPLDIETFALVPPPGQPEGIAVSDDGTVYVGTNVVATSSRPEPSKIFAFDSTGVLVEEYTVPGVEGLLGMAFDGDGRLYVVDPTPPRVFRLDPETGAQSDYTAFHDVLPCSQGGAPGDCSDTQGDDVPLPNYLVFAEDGTMYVTDTRQALIWRVPRGGGEPEVWFTDGCLEGTFGPNGIQFEADGETLLFAMTGTQQGGCDAAPANGALYQLRVLPDGSPDDHLSLFWESQPADGPDGFSIAASGNVYVALAGTNQIAVLSPTGAELARVPETPVDNALLDVPLDMPASTAFLGTSVLFTNQSLFAGHPDSWAVLDLFADEVGLPLHRPLPEPGSALALVAGAAALAALGRRRIQLPDLAKLPDHRG